MKALIALPLLIVALSGCAAKTAYRNDCAAKLERAWHEQSLAEAEGFAGTVSYSKAMALLAGAKTQQQFEGFRGCSQKADKALFYLRESRAGR